MSNQPPTYETYILRLWQERDLHGQFSAVWRFSLENTHTNIRLGFSSLEELCNYLSNQINLAKSS